jgi:hypothetical protein
MGTRRHSSLGTAALAATLAAACLLGCGEAAVDGSRRAPAAASRSQSDTGTRDGEPLAASPEPHEAEGVTPAGLMQAPTPATPRGTEGGAQGEPSGSAARDHPRVEKLRRLFAARRAAKRAAAEGSAPAGDKPEADAKPAAEPPVDPRLASGYVTDRVEAVEEIDPYGTGIEQLVAALQRDPAPEVRAAAALALGGSDGYVAVGALLGASHDPDPRVVVSALEALEFIGDATLIPTLTPLLQHRDDQVRAAAQRTIQSLR